MSSSVWPVSLRKVLNPAAVGNVCFLAVSNAFWTSASVTLTCCLTASAWYQYAVIRKSMTWLESEVKSCLQSVRSVAVFVLARLGIALRTWAMHVLKSGGSLGTITGSPGDWAAWLFAATNIQWLNACVEIGFPATSATESPGTPLPQPATPRANTKKAPSAKIDLRTVIGGRW